MPNRAEGAEPAGDGSYVVRPGDGMSSIADANGFFWQTLWDLPENAGLRKARGNPELLLAGDRVTIPEKRQKSVDAASGRKHVFVRRGVPAKLLFQLRDRAGKPLAGRQYELVVGADTFTGVTGGDGRIDRWVPPSAPRAELTVWLDHPGFPEKQTWSFAIGRVDPISTVSGLQTRLSNLSFPCMAELGTLGPLTRTALRRFQAEHGLKQTGDADDATRAALQKAYGV